MRADDVLARFLVDAAWASPEHHPDRRVGALYASLARWLPPPIAIDRTNNAAAALLLVEAGGDGDREDTPHAVIASVLRNEYAMRGCVATDAAVDAAVASWLRG